MSTRERRGFEQNNCFFITTTFRDWMPLFLDDGYYSIVADSLNYYGKQYNADTICYCLMPNHIHILLFFNDVPRCADYMRDLKKYTSAVIRRKMQQEDRAEVLAKLPYEKDGQKFKVWKDRYDAVVVRHKMVLLTKMAYIHNNPVKKGLVREDWQWKWSSAAWYKEMQSNDVVLRHAHSIM